MATKHPAINPAPISAINPALDTPTSTSVSCLLMQDAVDADTISLNGGPNTVALFANPFLGGKREALIIDEQGNLTYLRRTESATGWDQHTLRFSGIVVTAAEVVAVVHHADQSVWAIYTPAAGGNPRTLRLNATVSDGPTVSTWQHEDVIMHQDWKQVMHLTVSYCGQIPVVTGYDRKTGHLYSVHAVLQIPKPGGGSYRFVETMGPAIGGMLSAVVAGRLWSGSAAVRLDQSA